MSGFDDVPADLTKGVASMPTAFHKHAHVVAAGLVCAYYLGPQFIPKMRTPFFEIEPDADGNVSFRFGQRLLGVGETLFLLRNQPGFAEYVRRFREDRLRATFFECMVARLLLRAGFILSADPRRGVRGEDFDIQAVRGSDIVNVEVTALEEKPFSPRTLSNTIQSKRDQLPTNAPAAMFVIYPTSWVFENRASEFDVVANDVFSRTRRLNAMVFLGEELPEVAPGEGIAVFHAKAVFHKNPRHVTTALDFLPGDLRRSVTADFKLTGDVSPAPRVMDSEFLDWVKHALSDL